MFEKKEEVSQNHDSRLLGAHTHIGKLTPTHKYTHRQNIRDYSHSRMSNEEPLPHHEQMSLSGANQHTSSKEGQFDTVFTILILAILLSSLVFVGYYVPGIPIGNGGEQPLDRSGFLDSIRVNGGFATTVGRLNVSIFSVPGTVHMVDDNQVIVFEYSSGSELARDAARISGNGSFIDGKQYAWQASPHFYKKGFVLVLYLGSDQRTLALLSYVLGQPFTGAPIAFTSACSTTDRCPGTQTCVAFIGDTLCLDKDPCTLCGDGYSCKKVGTYPVEVICSK